MTTPPAPFGSSARAMRWAATNHPAWASAWSFDSFPKTFASDQTFPGLSEEQLYAKERMQEWAEEPFTNGVVLWGPAGVGKTSLALSALRWCAEHGDGLPGFWRESTSSGVRDAVGRGELRPFPAPCWFTSWVSLRRTIENIQAGRHPWPHDRPMMTVEGVFHELETRVEVLVVDDLDMGSWTPTREEYLLDLIRRVKLGRRLILTCNHEPVEAFQEQRIVDRLMDPNDFWVCHVTGPTLRRPR